MASGPFRLTLGQPLLLPDNNADRLGVHRLVAPCGTPSVAHPFAVVVKQSGKLHTRG